MTHELDGSETMTERRQAVVNKWWEAFQRSIQRHRTSLEAYEAGARQLLYWVPFSRHEDERLGPVRSALWGVLQLNRLVLEAAAGVATPGQAFGTSVAVGDTPHIHCVLFFRLGISILHCLWPMIQELLRYSTSEKLGSSSHSSVRRLVERLHFVLRLSILVCYWRKISQGRSIVPGLLLGGGSVYVTNAPDVEEESARVERLQYVGRRTGLTLGSRTYYPTRGIAGVNRLKKLVVALGEFLYCMSPLMSSETGTVEGATKWRAWYRRIFVELLALTCVHQSKVSGNIHTELEVRRRKCRLLLFALRSPMWDTTCLPMLERSTASLDRVPLLGSMVSHYIWENVLYWKYYSDIEG